MPPAWVVDAYRAAVDRVRVADNSDDDTAETITIALAEALMWIDVLRAKSRKAGRGQELSASVAADPVVQALAFVRGRLHHHWGSVVVRGDSSGRWLWNSADVLPEAPSRFADRDGEGLYRELLQARPVVATLERVGDLLKGVERP